MTSRGSSPGRLGASGPRGAQLLHRGLAASRPAAHGKPRGPGPLVASTPQGPGANSAVARAVGAGGRAARAGGCHGQAQRART
eukprot:8885893-Alexandrium_andersonii.AAC.1